MSSASEALRAWLHQRPAACAERAHCADPRTHCDSARCAHSAQSDPGGDIRWSAVHAWAVIAEFHDPDLRADLHDCFEEYAGFLEFEQGLLRVQAEHQAFGQLIFEILKRGIDVKAATQSAGQKGLAPRDGAGISVSRIDGSH